MTGYREGQDSFTEEVTGSPVCRRAEAEGVLVQRPGVAGEGRARPVPPISAMAGGRP